MSPTEEFSIRTAGVADIARLREIAVAADRQFAQVGMADLAGAEPTDAETFDRLIAARSVWIIEDSEAQSPIAFAVTAEIDTALHLAQVSVHPDYARQGVGRRLTEYLIDQARRSSHHAVTLTTFRDVPWNAPYYERLGFAVIDDDDLTDGLRQVRDREAEAGLDAWPRVCMRLRLD